VLIAFALAATLPGGIAITERGPPTDADVARAKAELAHGQRLYDEAQYEDALHAFEAAWQAYPVADFQYDIGLCYERLGRAEEAIAAFEAYLAQKPDATDRPNVEHRIGQLRATLRTTTPSEPTPAPVTVAPPRPPPPLTPAPTQPIADVDPHAGRRATIGGTITLVLGLGLAVGGGVGFGLPAARRMRAVDRALDPAAPPADRLTPDAARRTAHEGDRLLALQLASIGVGTVLVGTGIGLLVAGNRKRQNARLQAGLAPSRYGLTFAGAVRW
jgi:tetratricopeptide (TPR) repeat protein